MTRFSERKRTLLKTRRSKALSTFLIGLAVAACFFVPYMITSEGYFTFFGDFNVQQIPFYQMCHEAVRSGNTEWNWLTDLGANFVGSYSFYLLGSPFFWMTIPFPTAVVPYLMGPLLILKFACAALTGYLYIDRFARTPEAARLGGLLYAFSGFSVYNIFFNHFHEAIILFPLLLLALELLMTERRHGFFALMVAVCAVSNYFFFFGMVVFCVIYFIVRAVTGAVQIRFTRFLLMALEAVLGLFMAAFLLWPSILAVAGNGRLSEFQFGWGAILFGKEQIYLNVIECFFFPPDLPARPVFFPGAEVRWSSLGGWMPVFSMVGVFAFFFNRKGGWLKRLITVCVVMALVPVLNSAFYAFNDSYYARWFYMPILMMALATVYMIEDDTVDWSRAWKWVLGITAAFAAVIGFYPQKTDDGNYLLGLYMQEADEKILYPFPFLPKLGIAVEQTYFLRFWMEVLLALLGLMILRALLGLRKKDLLKFCRAATACVCVITVLYANFFVFTGRLHSYEIQEVMIDKLIEGAVDLPDSDDYRIDVYEGVDNTGMYLGLPTINAFHSVVPASIMDFYNYVGEERDVASRPSVDHPAIRSLLSVEFLLNAPTDEDGSDSFTDPDTGETRMPGFRYIKTSGGYEIYENENYVPYGYSYKYYMTQEFCDEQNEDDRSAWMTKAVLLTDEQIERYGGTMKNIETLYSEYDAEDPTATSLTLDDEALATDSANLRATAAANFSVDDNVFSARVVRDTDSLVVFPVPYDDGWKATVNGAPVKIEKVNVGFMAVPVTVGNSEIVFTYTTPGWALGLKISGIALGALVLYLLLAWLIGRKYPPRTVYPEGDELLYRWRNDELFRESVETVPEEPENTPSSLLTDPVEIPSLGEGFEGGFEIDVSAWKDDPAPEEQSKEEGLT